MADHLVSLPSGSVSPDVRAAIATLALAGSFASPGNPPLADLEHDLLARFAHATSIDAEAVLAWLQDAKATYHDMSDLVAQFGTNPVALHTALQQQNDAGGVVLLSVGNAGALTDAVSGAALHPGSTGSAWILRSGYSDEPPYGYYYDLGSPSAEQPVKILWQTVASAGIMHAIALEPPTPPVDREALLTTLQGASDALSSANQHLSEANNALAAAQTAHQTILASLGKG